MNSHVYKLKFDNSSSILNEMYERFSEHEKQNVANLDCDSFFDYHEHNDKYVCYIIGSPIEVKKYSQILQNNLITHQMIDLSKDIIKFEVDLESELKPLLSTVNSIKYSFFVDDLNEWIFSNLHIDLILDRILEVGIENLSVVEKKVFTRIP